MNQTCIRLVRLCFSVFLWLGMVATGFAQHTVTGKIMDKQTGETLIGASVVIQGTTEGTVTDIDGKFQLKTDRSLPLTLEISFLGYQKITHELTDWGDKVNIKLPADNVMLEAVEIVESRISEREKQAPLTVESMDVIAIKEAPSGNFYESLGNMKGVDMTSASLGFKVINTRGFNSTSPVRSLQLIDGVDNQSPGLNFSLGNFLGASDLDVMKVDIIAGASSAFYGPGAFNGVVNMTTKDPFTFPGLSASIKVGERQMQEYAVRWADVIKNKEGKDKFGYKLNFYYLSALDWEAQNFTPIDDSELPANNPGRFDAVNIYGDELSSAENNDFTSPGLKLTYPGLGEFRRSGYTEEQLADYDTENMKLNAAFHYKITDKVQAIASSSYSQGTTVYQGENRFSLNNIQFYQNRLEVKHDDKWFVRAYATHEDAGDSYDIVTTALRMQEATMSEVDWNQNYANVFRLRSSNWLRSQPDYPQLADFDNDQLAWEEAYDVWIQDYADTLLVMHQDAMWSTDTAPAPGLGDSKYLPGTAAYDSAFNDITSRGLGTEGGSRFYDKSALYHIQGEYKFDTIRFRGARIFDEIRVGGNYRIYLPDTRGTIFSDTLEYDRLVTDSGVILLDSNYREIRNEQFGAYFGLQRTFLDDKLIASFTLRLDKNQNFDYLYSPALSFVYSPNEKHTVRATFTSGNRNPTLADQYLYYDVGRATLLGNLDGYDSLVTTKSLRDFIDSGIRDTLDYFNVDAIRPEEVRTIEFGYRGLFSDKVYMDLSVYYSWYEHFIGFQFGSDFEIDPNFGRAQNIEVYRIAANSNSVVTTQGLSLGLNYYVTNNYSINGNYSYNELTSDDDDPLVPAFNTPKHKYNIGVTGREIYIPGVSLGYLGFGVNYKWIEGFIFEGSPQFTGFIDSYDLVDAQVNFTVPKIHTTFKVGASNLLDNRVYQVYGGPQVGRLAYFSVLFDWRKN